MSDKALLSNAELELTQRIQMHFPKGKISSEVIAQWNSCPAEVLKDHLADLFSTVPRKHLLEFIGNFTVGIPAGQYNIAELFKIGTHADGVNILGWYENFGQWCGQAIECVEATEINLRRHTPKHEQAVLDTSIISELGGASVVAIPLVLMRQLMSKQPRGEQGVLLTDNKANIAYWEDKNVKPKDKPNVFVNANGKKVVLRAVLVGWNDDGWCLIADSIVDSRRWHAPHQIFSR